MARVVPSGALALENIILGGTLYDKTLTFSLYPQGDWNNTQEGLDILNITLNKIKELESGLAFPCTEYPCWTELKIINDRKSNKNYKLQGIMHCGGDLASEKGFRLKEILQRTLKVAFLGEHKKSEGNER